MDESWRGGKLVGDGPRAFAGEDLERSVRRVIAESGDFADVDSDKVEHMIALLLEHVESFEEHQSPQQTPGVEEDQQANDEMVREVFGPLLECETDEVLAQLLVAVCQEKGLLNERVAASVSASSPEDGEDARIRSSLRLISESSLLVEKSSAADRGDDHAQAAIIGDAPPVELEESAGPRGKEDAQHVVIGGDRAGPRAGIPSSLAESATATSSNNRQPSEVAASGSKHKNINHTKKNINHTKIVPAHVARQLGRGLESSGNDRIRNRSGDDLSVPKKIMAQSKLEVERRRHEAQLEEHKKRRERAKDEEERREHELRRYFAEKSSSSTSTAATSGNKGAAPSIREYSPADSEANPSEQDVVEESAYAATCVPEVKEFLRKVGEPVTLFGESVWDRFLRYKEAELAHRELLLGETLVGSLTGGLTVQAALLKDKLREDAASEDDDEESAEDQAVGVDNSKVAVGGDFKPIIRKAGGGDGAAAEDAVGTSSKKRRIDVKQEAKDQAVEDGEGDEDEAAGDGRFAAVGAWLRDTLKAWELDLAAAAFEEDSTRVAENFATIVPQSTATSEGHDLPHRAEQVDVDVEDAAGAEAVRRCKQLARRFTRQQYREAKLCLKPLRKKLKEGSLELPILDKLALMVRMVQRRQYTEANSEYMKLAIGNAAWPLGVTNVGIHERAARSAIGEDKIAHVLSDEATRKYIHSFKRLMTYAAEKWPL
eukprot:g12839.t1